MRKKEGLPVRPAKPRILVPSAHSTSINSKLYIKLQLQLKYDQQGYKLDEKAIEEVLGVKELVG